MNEREHREELYTVNSSARESLASGAASRLNEITALVRQSRSAAETPPRTVSRNLWTRTIDRILNTLRRYAVPLHFIGYILAALALFLYARLVALTTRLITNGQNQWPMLPEPVVLALWHGDAPAFITAFARKRPRGEVGIMVARDPRGDSLALLCQMLGLKVVRGDSGDQAWEALRKLAVLIESGASVVITADGMGPSRVVKVGALALASATGAPIVPLGANCYPALAQRRKWDAARNPVPFGHISVFMGPVKSIPVISDIETLEKERISLQQAIEEASAAAARLVYPVSRLI